MLGTAGSRWNIGKGWLWLLLMAWPVRAQSTKPAARPDLLQQFNLSVESLSQRVSPAVVQILVTGYGAVEQHGRADTALIARQRMLGSGVIVDPDGYIITNAHVVQGAVKVRVMMFSQENGSSPDATLRTKSTVMNARIVGADSDTDLALLKVEAKMLPTLSFGRYQEVRQGQLVFAFGSPEGLGNSVSMGVVSSVARQPDPDHSMVYIQTDAPINPGSSGGPLVNAEGQVVGINTFILTESGGNEGLGFAIPSAMVRRIYGQLRLHGHVHREEIGAAVQTITPTLASGLGLSQDYGVIVSDVTPGGPAEAAGLKVQDIILRLDGVPVMNVPQFDARFLLRADLVPIHLDVLRATENVPLVVQVVETQGGMDRLADSLDPQKDMVPRLGILGMQIDARISAMVPDLRMGSGIIVAARTTFGTEAESGLATGDVIHAVNGVTIITLDALRAAVDKLKPGDAVVIQIERDGKLRYLAFEME
jgi:serine protease Do